MVTVDDEDLPFDTIMVDETEKVVSMTGYKSKDEWAQGCWRGEPAAQKAAWIIAKARKGENFRWTEAKFRDDIFCRYVDSAGRHIVLKALLDEHDNPVLDENGESKLELRNGRPILLYADTGEEVGAERPTEAAETQTNSETSAPPEPQDALSTSDTPKSSSDGTASVSSTPLTAAS